MTPATILTATGAKTITILLALFVGIQLTALVMMVLFYLASAKNHTQFEEMMNRILGENPTEPAPAKKESDRAHENPAEDKEEGKEEEDGGKAEGESPKEEKGTEAEGKEAVQGDPVPPAEFDIMAGEQYRCHPGARFDRRSADSMTRWHTSNEVVASIDEEGNLKAKKMGSVDVLFGDATIYRIRVLPNRERFTVDVFIKMVQNGITAEQSYNPASMARSATPVTQDAEGTYQEFKEDGTDGIIRSFTLLKDGRVDRVLLQIDDPDLETLTASMAERFSEVLRDDDNERYVWAHETETRETDLIAFLRRDSLTGYWTMGIGHTWRTGGEINEIEENNGLVERCFEDGRRLLKKKEDEGNPVPGLATKEEIEAGAPTQGKKKITRAEGGRAEVPATETEEAEEEDGESSRTDELRRRMSEEQSRKASKRRAILRGNAESKSNGEEDE